MLGAMAVRADQLCDTHPGAQPGTTSGPAGPVGRGDVRAVAAAMRGLVGRLEPAAVPLPEVMDLVRDLDAIRRLADAALTLLADRIEQSGVWERRGFAGPAEHLAALAGVPVGQARQIFDTARHLDTLPATETALRSGRLSSAQAAAVTAGAAANPAAERSLLEVAATQSVRDLRDAAARVRAAADPDPDATRARIHAERQVRVWCDPEGGWNLTARGTTDAGARIMATLERLTNERFEAARRDGDREPHEAYAFDALVAMADRAEQHDQPDATHRSGTRRATRDERFLALLRLDLAALVRGHPDRDELCEIAGVGPIPVSTARTLLGDSILKLVLTKGADVANVVHLGRGPSAAQRIALLWTSPQCTNQACPHRWTQVDHRVPYEECKVTELANLDPMCARDHWLKTYRGWAYVDGTGRRAFVAPDDPRHPDQTQGNARPPP
jgi:hypothetical protein